MINRYQGNSGRVERVPDSAPAPRPAAPRGAPPPPPAPASAPRSGLLQGLSGLTSLLPEKLGELETEDYILLLILYLMYRESGDSELLIIMGAMFLL